VVLLHIQGFWDVTVCCWLKFTEVTLLDPEDEGTMILQDINKYLSVNMEEHPNRLESSNIKLFQEKKDLEGSCLLGCYTV
jgi:hypothetical protein